ncbi:MAG: GNAT family N-acetyltransferase [Phototrophicales bacterium]|nr:MAG: GNAT family N-acetyltransferase [Phototrophicales bacterium]RMG74310.1 MAG: GNAT family N-acetyltransferase [Chloroflexota bacterium]
MSEENKSYTIRPLDASDRNWVAHFLDQHWGSTKIVSRMKTYYAHLLPGFVVERVDAPDDAPPAGLITYHIEGKSCEIITLNSLEEGQGVGTLMIETVKAVAKENGCKRLWLIITNDNLNALKFYQKRGFELVAVHRNALAESRKLKPQIPLVGLDDIPLRDEIELEIML